MSNTLFKDLNKKFCFCESKSLKECLSNINLTYSYLTEFVGFHKKFDDKFCITSIPINHYLLSSERDIQACLNKRDKDSKFIIHYIKYNFTDDKHGKEYQNVYLMFFLIDEEETVNLLKKFIKLKAFL